MSLNNNLNNFYRSKEWINLVRIIRLERGDICEHCGKPMVRAYDCIGHHVIELTEQNVHDASISLNPDNIMLVHHRCHNKIHDRLGLSRRKQVYLVYGAPCSGKTTFVHDNMEYGDMVVDMDSIWQCVSGMSMYDKPNRLKSNVFGIRNCMIDMIRMRQGNWLNAWIIGGYPLISERERLCRELGAREIHVDTSKEECLKRLHENPEGRDVTAWAEFIEAYPPTP